MEQLKEVWPGWETVRLIGRGSFGNVYEVERKIGSYLEKAAVKIISIPKDESEMENLLACGMDEESVAMTLAERRDAIINEYMLMRRLGGSSHVVHCDDFMSIPHPSGNGYDVLIRMELLTPLTTYLKTEKLEESSVIRLGIDLCKALVLCAKHNIIHRDIKLSNIFLAEDGSFKLGDFGVSRVMEEGTQGHNTMGIGTPDYMAPEVVAGGNYDARVDIYSLGMVLYWLLNERKFPFLPQGGPVRFDQLVEAKERRLRGEALPAPLHGTDGLKAIVLQACAFASKERFASAADLLQALQQLQIDEVHPVVKQSVPQVTAQPATAVSKAEVQAVEREEEVPTGNGGAGAMPFFRPTGEAVAPVVDIPVEERNEETVSSCNQNETKDQPARGNEDVGNAPEEDYTGNETVSTWNMAPQGKNVECTPASQPFFQEDGEATVGAWGNLSKQTQKPVEVPEEPPVTAPPVKVKPEAPKGPEMPESEKQSRYTKAMHLMAIGHNTGSISSFKNAMELLEPINEDKAKDYVARCKLQIEIIEKGEVRQLMSQNRYIEAKEILLRMSPSWKERHELLTICEEQIQRGNSKKGAIGKLFSFFS